MELQQVMGKKDEQQMLNPNMYTPQEVAPLSQQKGIGEQFGDMAKQKIMSGAVDKGTEALISGATAGGEAMLGSSAMAGLGTAMPYVGAGLMAGKALGLFNAGGQVGPLSAQYIAQGGMPEGYNYKRARYSPSQGIDEANLRAMQQAKEIKDYIEEQDFYESLDAGIMGGGGGYSAGGPISAQYKAEGGLTEDQKMLQNIMNTRQPRQDYSDLGSARKKVNQMSRKQAIALMNNQPEPTPMPMARPEDLYDEIIMEQIGPLARPQMQDYGADRTSSPYDMLRPDNAPNT